ncbi:septum formation family protein [Isoptericola variabilis]|uniref:Septum formation-related domain-containing protein n=1 Tax=Isoptericola variabilis (strain 225) TaxID=743718 RepID=F6FSW0_ISOV2|nr:septum formation family protein [Isoptericola variabilis]AEG43101.1 hypothetical protein Isova_0299 [Isoptericola variabilis 225]TWH35028.1 putative regulator of septum formation [Isoptericola variabilis J7]
MSSEPSEPTFASPTPPGSLPPADLDRVHLPGPAPVPAHAPDDGTPAPYGDAAAAYGPPGAYGTPGAYAAPRGPSPSPSPRSRSRRRLAVAIVAVAVVAVLAAVVALVTQSARERSWEPLPATLEEPVRAQAVQLVLGSCVAELPDDGLVRGVQAVPCADPHEAQVVGRTDAAPDAVWPGDDAVAARTARGCGPDLLGPQARESGAADGLRYVVWVPSEDSWADGDRTGLCLAVSAEPRTGTLLE